MPASDQATCGEWLPRSQSPCGRKPGHAPPHESTESLERRRRRRQRRVRNDDPSGRPAVAADAQAEAVWADPGRLRPAAEGAGVRLRDVLRAVRSRPGHLHRPRPRLLPGRKAVLWKLRARAARPVLQHRAGPHRAEGRTGPCVPGQSKDSPARRASGSSTGGWLGGVAPDVLHDAGGRADGRAQPVPVDPLERGHISLAPQVCDSPVRTFLSSMMDAKVWRMHRASIPATVNKSTTPGH